MKHLKTLRTIIVLILLFGAVSETIARRQDENQAFEAFIEKAFALDLAPGMAVAVVKGDAIIYAKGFGYADIEAQRRVTPETRFYIASTTKSFTAFAAALLHERGALDLDAPLRKYLPNVRLQAPLSTETITMRELLTHTHGISGDGPVVFRTAFSGDYTREQLLLLLEKHGSAPNGKTFAYSNIGYNVAGFAMEAKLQTDWKSLLEREIFKPLGMKNTSAYMSKVDRNRLALPHFPEEKGFRKVYYAKHDANMHAAGGHVSTVLDLAAWIKAHLNAGRFEGKQVFPPAVVAETHRWQATQDRNFAQFHRYGWGFGWDLGTYESDTLLHRFGSFNGFFSHVSFMPEHKIGVTVLVNGAAFGGLLANTVACYVYDALLNKAGLNEKSEKILAQLREQAAQGRKRISDDKTRRAERPQTLPHPLMAYAGTYENPDLGRMQWQVVNGKLEVKMGLLWSVVEVSNGEQNRFRVELTGSGEDVAFSVQGGRAESLIYDDRKFVKIAAN